MRAAVSFINKYKKVIIAKLSKTTVSVSLLSHSRNYLHFHHIGDREGGTLLDLAMSSLSRRFLL